MVMSLRTSTFRGSTKRTSFVPLFPLILQLFYFIFFFREGRYKLNKIAAVFAALYALCNLVKC